MRYSNCLKKHRELIKLKQKHVAHLLGIKNTSLISRWEKGVQLPDLTNALKLARLYNATVEQLFSELRKSITFNPATEEIVDILFD